MNYGIKGYHFLGQWKMILVYLGRWSYGRFKDDNNIFYKMKNDLTTGTWQEDIWCPIIIILFCTFDEIIQATTTLIDPGCSVWDEDGIQRSGGQFFTTRCTNMKVDKHDIELQCWWSTNRANGVRTVQQSMIHNYSEVRNTKQALICPSKACWDWHQGPWS